LGREAAAAAKESVTRRLACMVTDDPAIFLSGKEPIAHEGSVIGYVTSAAYGATVGQSIAYGYLPVPVAEPGTALEVYAEGEWHRLTVAAEPLFDPTSSRPRDVEEPATVEVA
jgi:glycine cleavage system aminomethyltransferase T